MLLGRIVGTASHNRADTFGKDGGGIIPPSKGVDDRAAIHRGVDGGGEPQKVDHDDHAGTGADGCDAVHAPFERCDSSSAREPVAGEDAVATPIAIRDHRVAIHHHVFDADGRDFRAAEVSRA
jgi:hypothetical protein